MFMSLYNFNAILKIAQERDFKAIGSFNLHCIEMLPAFFKAAQQSDSPLMIQISTGTAEYLGYRLLVDAVRSLAESENVPTCLHLDHCSDISAIETAMDAGFTSVMYDGSHLDLEENIGNTRIVVGLEALHGENVTPVKFVVAWTENGALKGGTAQALRIATALNIPIINLGRAQNAQELEAMVLAVDELQADLKNKKVIG